MIEIRPASPPDAAAIAEFQVLMARETEGVELDATTVARGVSAVFADPAKGTYYVAVDAGCRGLTRLRGKPRSLAERGGTWVVAKTTQPTAPAIGAARVAGCLLITREWSDWRGGTIWWIQSVYVVPEARGRGVFRALYEHVRALAADDPAVLGLRLYVDKRNARAQKVYESLGMNGEHYQVFEWMKA